MSGISEPAAPRRGVADLTGIGPRLREAISSSTVAGVAARTGVSTGAIRKYLRSAGVPPLEFLLAVAREYEVSVEWLITGRGMMREADYARVLLRTATLAELALALEDRLAVLKGLDPSDACQNLECPRARALAASVRDAGQGPWPEAIPVPEPRINHPG